MKDNYFSNKKDNKFDIEDVLIYKNKYKEIVDKANDSSIEEAVRISIELYKKGTKMKMTATFMIIFLIIIPIIVVACLINLLLISSAFLLIPVIFVLPSFMLFQRGGYIVLFSKYVDVENPREVFSLYDELTQELLDD